MLDDDQLEIVVARMVDRVSDDPDRAPLAGMRSAGVVRHKLGGNEKKESQRESGRRFLAFLNEENRKRGVVNDQRRLD